MVREGGYFDSDYTEAGARRGDRAGWKWLLLIPLFFLVGWFANDTLANNATTNGLEVGVGGGPNDTVPCVTPGTSTAQ